MQLDAFSGDAKILLDVYTNIGYMKFEKPPKKGLRLPLRHIMDYPALYPWLWVASRFG